MYKNISKIVVHIRNLDFYLLEDLLLLFGIFEFYFGRDSLYRLLLLNYKLIVWLLHHVGVLDRKFYAYKKLIPTIIPLFFVYV